MKPRTASRLGWSLVALFTLLAGAGLWAVALGRPTGSFVENAVYVVIFESIAVVGALVVSRQPGNAFGWVFLSLAAGAALAFFGSEYGHYSFAVRSTPLPGAVPAAWFGSWTWTAVFVLPPFVLLLFPDGRLPSRRWRPVAGFAGLVAAVLGFFSILAPRQIAPSVPNPTGVDALRGVGDPFFAAAYPLILLLALVSASSLIVRFRRAQGAQRQQIKWFAFAAAFMATEFMVSAVLREVLHLRLGWPGTVFDALAYLSLPVGAGIAILRYRLFDIDVVISRTVLYGLLAAIVTALYLAIVVGIGALVGSQGSLPLSILATAVIALGFHPLRERARRLANRMVYGKRATPYEVLSEFGERLAGSYSADDALPRLARVVGQGVGATRATVWLHLGRELAPAATWGLGQGSQRGIPLDEDRIPEFPDDDRAFEVRHQGELLGALTVVMPPRQALTPTGEKLLQDLAAQAGLVLRNVRLIEELRASRQRIVAAQDEERRRLERNIHDGAQQQLVALAVKLRLVETLAAKDPDRAAAMAAQAKAEVQDALENMRDLARGIYPPLLADKGLAAALDAQARKAALPVTVSADGVDRLPQDVEAGVYFCVLEALQNIAKYAEASSATVRLGTEDGHLAFEVADDGRGFDPATTPRGSGLQNMADRLEALGGSIEIRSAPGEGTTVTGRVPVQAPVA
jgi:signal transduction histidine kinase